MIIVRRTFWYASGTASAFIVSILSLPIGTLVLGPSDYGVFALVTAILGIGSLFTIAAVQVILSRDLPLATGETRALVITTILAFSVAACSALGALAATAVFVFSGWFAREWAVTPSIALAGAGTMIASTIWTVFTQLLVLDGRAREHALASIAASVTTLAALSASLFLLELGAVSLFIAQIGGSGVAAALAARLYRGEITGPLDRVLFGRILSTLPSASLANLLDALYRAVERTIITSVGGASALGLYAHAQMYSQAVNQSLKTVSHSVWPETLREAREASPSFSTTRRVWQCGHIFLLVAGLIFVPFSEIIVSSLTHGKFAGAALLATLWMVAATIQNAGVLNLGHLYANGFGTIALRINALSALAGIALLPALVPHFGIYGAFGAMLGHLLVRRIGLAVRCRRYGLPALDGRLYIIASVLAGLVAAKGVWSLSVPETLGLSAAILFIWLTFDRGNVRAALAAFARG